MLGGHERDCARPRSRAACPGSRVLVTTRSLTIFQATAREQLSQQSRTGEPDEPGGHGQAHPEALALEDVRTGQREQIASVAVLAMIGAEPQTQWLRDLVKLNDRGFIVTGRDVSPGAWPLPRPPLLVEDGQIPAPKSTRVCRLACRLASDEIRLLQ